MQKKVYESLKETLYEEVLPNGLKVFLLPKPDYNKVYGLFTTNYGSVDNEFLPIDSEEFIHVPDGIAHFLEHKLFEEEEGDVFQKFSLQGASANAFTSFTKTSYLFSTTDKVYENTKTLIDFVQHPYFLEDSVEREKGIIGQEIQMYQDDPNWRLFFGILQNLYPNHPLSVDIAGSIESINQITAQTLYACYHTFYHPSNMTLFVVGRFDAKEMMTFIKENQASKEFAPIREIKRHLPKLSPIIKHREIEMEVARPKFILGLRGEDELPEDKRELLKYKLSMNLFGQLLFGDTSSRYLNWYDEGLVDDSFDEEFSLDRMGHLFMVSGDSNTPKVALQEVTQLIENFESSPEMNEYTLELLKKRILGKSLQSLNSLEYIANQFSQSLFGDITLFDLPQIIKEITLEDVLTTAKKFIKLESMSTFIVNPAQVKK
ncbi:MAG: insulinase family protein [Streptococcaceae bacterium]|jgi:predicted Zn-dependent peptidase|nr:insulinase family protein [Streptococcaceae bacterium]